VSPGEQDRDVTAQLNARGDVAVLVPAAGAGLRLGPGGPKALRPLAGEPLLVHAVRRIAAAPSVRLIVVAAPAAEVDAVRALLAPVAAVTVVAGGAERQHSVAAALAVVPPDLGIVLVHDAARALTPPALIESVAAAIRGGRPAVIPVLPVVDTIKEIGTS
jgi:2-C-methyl-D-erythritol 4-phosphate cytidylyltransferase